MHLLTLGVNHQTAPLALREQVAFLPEEIGPAIGQLQNTCQDTAGGALTEIAIVSTCNRTELYCAVQDPQAATAAIMEYIAQTKGVSVAQLDQATYKHNGLDAVRQAFKVACGLDSMVLGEPQILGQMKQAEKIARDAGGLGPWLNHLFQSSFAVAKEVRTHTDIGAHSVSMAAAAVKVAERIFGPLTHSKVLFVGAGEMIELCATHFAAHAPQSITVASRTVSRARALATRFNGHALSLAELPNALPEHDIVVSCTASALPLIGLGMVERALRVRRHRPMFLVDLAVPRDMEPEISALDDVYVYTVDDLGNLVQSSHALRQAAAAQAQEMIENGVSAFETWMNTRSAVPVIQQLRARGDTLRKTELERALKQLARGDDPTLVLERLSQSLTNKFLHGPLTALREAQNQDATERSRTETLLRQLFG